MGCEFFFAREFFSVKMLHRRVCVLDVCFGMSRNSLFSLGDWISPPQVVLMDWRRWAEMVQAWPDKTQRKTLVCNDWPQEWDNQSPPWGLKNGLEGWVGDRDFSLSLPGLKAVIPLYAHRVQCPSLFSHVMKLISKESRPSGMREGTRAAWILPCLQLEFQLAFSLESPWAHKWSLPAFAVKCCGRGSRRSCLLVISVMSSSLRPCGLQPARLLCPRDFLGKNTGVGCCALLQGVFPTQGWTRVSCTAGRVFTAEPPGKPQDPARAKSLQLFQTLCGPVDYSPPGFSVHGILQARTLEWAAISSSRGSCLMQLKCWSHQVRVGLDRCPFEVWLSTFPQGWMFQSSCKTAVCLSKHGLFIVFLL